MSLNHPDLLVKLLHSDSKKPSRAHSYGDAGLDLYSYENEIIPPLERKSIKLGIAIALPANTYGRIAPRSGLAKNFGIDVFAGVIDESYRSELEVILFNSSKNSFDIKKGDKIAQLIIEKIYYSEVKIVEKLSETERGEKGFGSSDEIKDNGAVISNSIINNSFFSAGNQ